MGSMRLLVGSGAAVVAAAGLWVGAPGRSDAATVKVERGQTLTAIAARYHTTVAELVRLNGLKNPDRVVAGQTLKLPAGEGGSASNGAGSTGGGRPMPGAARLGLVPLFHRWGVHYGVPVSLLEALTWWESGWQQGVVSSTGAVGIGQLEPGTVKDMRVLLGDPTLSARSSSDNIRMSAAYLAGLLGAAGGDRSVALAAYYQGLASVKANGAQPATRHYVQGILAYERIFETSGP